MNGQAMLPCVKVVILSMQCMTYYKGNEGTAFLLREWYPKLELEVFSVREREADFDPWDLSFIYFLMDASLRRNVHVLE